MNIVLSKMTNLSIASLVEVILLPKLSFECVAVLAFAARGAEGGGWGPVRLPSLEDKL